MNEVQTRLKYKPPPLADELAINCRPVSNNNSLHWRRSRSLDARWLCGVHKVNMGKSPERYEQQRHFSPDTSYNFGAEAFN